MMSDKLVVPRLKVKRDRHVGLNPDPVDRSHPDVHDDQLVQEAILDSVSLPAVNLEKVNASNTVNQEKQNTSQAEVNALNTVNKEKHNASLAEGDSKLMEKIKNYSPEERTSSLKNGTNAYIKPPKNINDTSEDSGADWTSKAENGTNTRRQLLEDNASNGSEESGSGSRANIEEGVHAATVENDIGLEADADSSFELFGDSDELADEYNYDYDDYVDETMWGDEEWTEEQHETLENYVIADINNDGVAELVVAVSYFFDHEYHDNPEHLKELGGIDIGKYVAGGKVREKFPHEMSRCSS